MVWALAELNFGWAGASRSDSRVRARKYHVFHCTASSPFQTLSYGQDLCEETKNITKSENEIFETTQTYSTKTIPSLASAASVDHHASPQHVLIPTGVRCRPRRETIAKIPRADHRHDAFIDDSDGIDPRSSATTCNNRAQTIEHHCHKQTQKPPMGLALAHHPDKVCDVPR